MMPIFSFLAPDVITGRTLELTIVDMEIFFFIKLAKVRETKP